MDLTHATLTAVWITAHALGGLVAAWTGGHIGSRLHQGAPLLKDAWCDRCAAPLGWRQLPLVGRLRGCGRCGARGPASAPWIEGAGAVVGASVAAAAPQWALPACAAWAGVSIGVGWAVRRIEGEKG